MRILRWNSFYTRLNDTLGHFFPRRKWQKWFVYPFMTILVLLLEPKYESFRQNIPSFRNLCPHILVYGGLRDSGQLTHLFDCLSFSILLDAILTSSNVMFSLFVCVFADCCQAKDQYIEQFKDTLNTSVAKSIAGFFVEPIQVGILAWDINWTEL